MARLVALILALGMAGIVGAGTQSDDVLARMAKAEALWAARKPAIYEFRVELVCFCLLPQVPPQFRVTNGVATPVAPLDGRDLPTFSRHDTVEKLFARAREMAAGKAYKFAVEFDAQFGYPTLIQVDRQQLTADDELTIRVTAFRAVTESGPGSAQTSAGIRSFDRTLQLESTSETSANVSIGDLNGDGHPDLVLVKGRHWPLVDKVLLNDGHGRFTAHDLGVASDRSYSGLLADLDGDGDLDVVISNDAPDPKLTYLNDGKGTFRVGSAYGRPEWPMRNARVADLNGDGRPDIIVANRTDTGGANYICLNKGQGRFDRDCLAFSHESATTITAADFNKDGFADLLVPHRDVGQSYLYLNDGKAAFTRVPFGPADAAFRMAEAADFNGDGLLDVVAIDERRGTFVYFGLRDGHFSSPVTVADAKVVPYALTVGDLNRNGLIDVVVGHVEAPSIVYFNDGSGRRFTPVPFGDNKGTVYGFAIGDLDEDGVLDIAAARSDAPNMIYFGAVRR